VKTKSSNVTSRNEEATTLPECRLQPQGRQRLMNTSAESPLPPDAWGEHRVVALAYGVSSNSSVF
jgi:hypothetical protein